MTELTREDEYNIILKHLGSITSLRKFADQQNFSLLEEISNKEPNNARLFKTEKDALDAYRILTMYGHKVTIEKKEVKK
ncbi:DNA-bending protein with chaperone activity [Klebsiella pneumoniae]|nr:DNA-bending protein with chaperone activity [Klebsiella pneumoniae]HBY9737764.1 hypothetical protein [Klebsiella pneumoniae]HBY9803274.1 hypothetical protein [Klebsiella pneumoniae]